MVRFNKQSSGSMTYDPSGTNGKVIADMALRNNITDCYNLCVELESECINNPSMKIVKAFVTEANKFRTYLAPHFEEYRKNKLDEMPYKAPIVLQQQKIGNKFSFKNLNKIYEYFHELQKLADEVGYTKLNNLHAQKTKSLDSFIRDSFGSKNKEVFESSLLTISNKLKDNTLEY